MARGRRNTCGAIAARRARPRAVRARRAGGGRGRSRGGRPLPGHHPDADPGRVRRRRAVRGLADDDGAAPRVARAALLGPPRVRWPGDPDRPHDAALPRRPVLAREPLARAAGRVQVGHRQPGIRPAVAAEQGAAAAEAQRGRRGGAGLQAADQRQPRRLVPRARRGGHARAPASGPPHTRRLVPPRRHPDRAAAATRPRGSPYGRRTTASTRTAICSATATTTRAASPTCGRSRARRPCSRARRSASGSRATSPTSSPTTRRCCGGSATSACRSTCCPVDTDFKSPHNWNGWGWNRALFPDPPGFLRLGSPRGHRRRPEHASFDLQR